MGDSVCGFCGKSYYQTNRAQKYCCSTCQQKAWKAIQPKKTQRYTGACVNCGKVFSTNYKAKRFCTSECNWAFHNAKRPTTKEQQRECPVCGKKFVPMQKRGVGKLYCSVSCRGKANYSKNSAKRRSRHWEYRKRTKMGGNWWPALQRDRFTCQLCKSTLYPSQWVGSKQLIVHHLDGTGEEESKNHNIENLLTLCSKCHKLFHSTLSIVFVDGVFKIKGRIFDYLETNSLLVHRNGK